MNLSSDELIILTSLEDNNLRLSDLSKVVNMSKIKISSLLIGLMEKGYLAQKTVKITENYMDNYYYINPSYKAKLDDELDFDVDEKISYIKHEIQKISQLIIQNKNDINMIRISTVKLNKNEIDELIEKLKDITHFLQKSEHSQEVDDEKYSLIVLLAKRDDLSKESESI